MKINIQAYLKRSLQGEYEEHVSSCMEEKELKEFGWETFEKWLQDQGLIEDE